MRGSALASTPEDDGRVKGREEPEERVDEIDPDGALHADNAVLFGSVVGVDEDLAEHTKECDPQDAVATLLAVKHFAQTGEDTYKSTQSQKKAQ